MDLVLELAADFECFLSVLGCQDGVPFSRQYQPDQIPDHRLVFGNQYDSLLVFHKYESSLKRPAYTRASEFAACVKGGFVQISGIAPPRPYSGCSLQPP